MLPNTSILLFCLLTTLSPHIRATLNLILPHQHPNPEAVVQQVQRRLNVSVSKKQLMLDIHEMDQSSCLTGNPIDDCWRCDPNWQTNRQQLANCGIGFGQDALGGKGGQIYVVTDSSDHDPANPSPGTLRHAVVQTEPLWIIFSCDMLIKLKKKLIVNSFKTIDGRGANVHIIGGGCIVIQSVTNVIIHNINVHHCVPSQSDGDGIHIFESRKIWVDHCTLSYCMDGLIDVTMGSTAITISNNYFSHHDKVMLLGHNDDYVPDDGMQVTIAFNHFGEALVQRMPRCRRGYFHVVNNDYTQWGMYAIGGSVKPTINSQGNRYIAPADLNAKEVTRRLDTGNGWENWNWRSDGDILINGAFFVPSGDGLSAQYALASSVEPRSAGFIDQLTMNAGVLVGNGDNSVGISNPGDNGVGISNPGDNSGGASTAGNSSSNGDVGMSSNGYVGTSYGDVGGYFGMIYGSAASPPPAATTSIILSLLYLVILILCITIIHGPPLPLPLLLL